MSTSADSIREAIRSAGPGQKVTSIDDAVADGIKSDTKLKEMYAKWFIGIMIGQLLVMNIVFAAVGLGWLNFTQYIIHLYMGGTLTEVFGIVLVITRYLFPKR